jgi:hypothetical protein
MYYVLKRVLYLLKPSKMLKWWKKHIIDDCPKHLDDLF